MHSTKYLRAIRQLFMNGRQLPTAFRILSGQRQPLRADIHPPGRLMAETDPLTVPGAVVHAATPGGLQPLGLLDDPAALVLGHQQLREHGYLPRLGNIIEQLAQLRGRLQQPLMLLAAGAQNPAVITTPFDKTGNELRGRFLPGRPEGPGGAASQYQGETSDCQRRYPANPTRHSVNLFEESAINR